MAKTASLPQVRVDAALREQVEAVALAKGETISDFVESAVRRALDHHALHAEFFARGKAASEHFAQTGGSHSTEDVLQELRQMTASRRSQLTALLQK